MLRNISRRSLLAGLGAMAATGEAFAGAPARSLRPHLRGQKDRLPYFERPEDLLETAGISGDLAWSVADVKSGLILESVQGSTGLPPASVAKALTTLYALETLGPDYRFKTQVLARADWSAGSASLQRSEKSTFWSTHRPSSRIRVVPSVSGRLGIWSTS